MLKPAKNTICLWYDGDAEDAARFYAKTMLQMKMIDIAAIEAAHRG